MGHRETPDHALNVDADLGLGLTPGQVMHARKKGDRRYERLRKQLMESEFALEVETQFGALDRLKPAGGRLPLGPYLAALWRRRHFIWRDVKSRVRTSNANERLGSLWLVLRPLLDAAFYGLIFGLVLKAGRGTENFVAFILIGIFMFQFTNAAISQSPGVIRQQRALIRAFSFPRAAIPVSLVIRQLLQAAPGFAVMLVLIWAIPPHEQPTLLWLFFPVLLGIQVLLNLGIALGLARFGHAIPDLGQFVSFVGRILLYASGVIFPIDRFVNHPVALFVVELNPIYQFIDSYRMILMQGALPSFERWMTMLAWSIGTLVVGFLTFWLKEESYGRE